MPSQAIDSRASEATGLTVQNGGLYLHSNFKKNCMYMCMRRYMETWRVVHIFLYMSNILLIVFVLYFDGNLLRPSEAYMRK